MVIPLLPFFLTSVLGAGALALGFIEGLADAVSSVLKLLSGRWADRMRRRRPLVLLGYGIAAVARPLVGAATAASHVLAVRLADRVGKGIRTSPRDALISQSVEPSQRGAAFGLQRAMDHAGAVAGPLLAAAYVAYVSTDVRPLFWLTAIPGAATLLVLWLGVKETDPPAGARPGAAHHAASPDGRRLARFLLPLALFTLGNASDVFLLLKAGGERTPLVALPLLWVGLHVVKAISSVPGGKLADRAGRRPVIAAGWIFYAAIYAGFAFTESPAGIAALFLAYGLYHGLTEAAERALVSEIAPKRAQGAAFGWYHFTLGIAALAASVLFGGLWQAAGMRAAFLTSAALAVLASILLLLTGSPARGDAKLGSRRAGSWTRHGSGSGAV